MTTRTLTERRRSIQVWRDRYEMYPNNYIQNWLDASFLSRAQGTLSKAVPTNTKQPQKTDYFGSVRFFYSHVPPPTSSDLPRLELCLAAVVIQVAQARSFGASSDNSQGRAGWLSSARHPHVGGFCDTLPNSISLDVWTRWWKDPHPNMTKNTMT